MKTNQRIVLFLRVLFVVMTTTTTTTTTMIPRTITTTLALSVSPASPSNRPHNTNTNAPRAMSIADRVKSVNYFVSRECNYKCKFCFHTQKNTNKLNLGEAQLGLELLKQAGTEKINFAGGEPFMNPQLLGELVKYASHDLGMAVSIISNGSLIQSKWMKEYGQFVDVLGVSVDSFHPETNALIGRGGDANNKHIDRMLRVRELCTQHDILFKLNTVVCSHNYKEDMNAHITQLDPYRWKVFQVLILKGENSGMNGDLRNAFDLQVTKTQFDTFCQRHADQPAFIPEPNDVMQNSYLLLDEELRFLDCSQGGKVPSESILQVGVERALSQAGFDHDMFHQRGGIYKWTRDRSTKESSQQQVQKDHVVVQEITEDEVLPGTNQKNLTLAYAQ